MFSKRFWRFLLVGGSNAVLHFSVLNACFSLLGTNKILSSIIATLCAMTYSFLLNKKFVFRSSQAIKKEVFAFIAVTVSGVLIVHNLIYIFVLYLLDHNISIVTIIEKGVNYRISQDSIEINIATLVGALVVLIWNYTGYKRFVFINKKVKDEFEHQIN